MPWLLNEDEAIKKKLQGLTVPDVNAPPGGRPVPVRFRFPEGEISKVTFPLIVIEHGPLTKASDREHRGQNTQIPYAPEGEPTWADMTDISASPYFADEYPIPYDIDYVITTNCRKAMHDRLLTAALAGQDRLHTRYAYLEIPEDGTIRRLDVIGGPEPTDTIDTDGKRLFRKTYVVRVSSELLPSQISTFEQVLTVGIQLSQYAETYGYVPVS